MNSPRTGLLANIRDRSARRLLRAAREEARDSSSAVYLVGGSVRDLVLGAGLRDIDLVVAGDPGAFAARLAARIGARLPSPTRFRTWRILAPAYPPIDVAMARSETYARAAALPEVRPAPIEADLARRDFTINAMAIALAGEGSGRLLDPTGGLEDLKARRLRLLHAGSLVDDPTRSFRGARYAARFGLRPDASLRDALSSRAARGALSKLGGERLGRELARIWSERDPAAIFSRLSTWGLLAAIHPRLEWRGRLSRSIRRGQRLRATWEAARSPELMLALAAATLHGSARAKLWDRLALAGRGRRLLLLAAAAPARAARLGRSYRDASEAASWPPLVLLTVFAAGTPSATARIRALRRSWIGAIPRLGAADLLREGIPEGPRLGRMLEELRRARFGGKTRNRGDELRRIRSRS